MASCERPTYTQAIPPRAILRTEAGERYACWTDRNGKAVRALVLPNGRCRRTVAGRWIGCYRDHGGIRRKTKPYGDRSAALAVALELEKKGRAVKDGRAMPEQPQGKAFLVDHVPAYAEALAVRGKTDDYRAEAEAILRKLIFRVKLTTAGSVDPAQLDSFLEKLRRTGRPPRADGTPNPLSLRTRNKWAGTLKAFGTWLEDTGRCAANPFRKLTMANQDTDPRHVRRALAPAELGKCLEAAGKGPECRGLSGADRHSLYLCAAYTGFRSGSLLALTPESFAVEGPVVRAVTVKAQHAKNRKGHTVPLSPDVGRLLAEWLKGKKPGKPVWKPSATNTEGTLVRMLRFDLKAAGVPYRDAAGAVFDFHALRGQYATMLVLAGTPGGIVQRLMDHSDPKLTARYTRLVPEDLAEWVDRLPSLGAPLGSKVGGSRVKGPANGKSVQPPKTKKTRRS
jgi:integrase